MKRFVLALLVVSGFTLLANLAWHSSSPWLWLILVIIGWPLLGATWLVRSGIASTLWRESPRARPFTVFAIVLFSALWVIPFSVRLDEAEFHPDQT